MQHLFTIVSSLQFTISNSSDIQFSISRNLDCKSGCDMSSNIQMLLGNWFRVTGHFNISNNLKYIENLELDCQNSQLCLNSVVNKDVMLVNVTFSQLSQASSLPCFQFDFQNISIVNSLIVVPLFSETVLHVDYLRLENVSIQSSLFTSVDAIQNLKIVNTSGKICRSVNRITNLVAVNYLSDYLFDGVLQNLSNASFVASSLSGIKALHVCNVSFSSCKFDEDTILFQLCETASNITLTQITFLKQFQLFGDMVGSTINNISLEYIFNVKVNQLFQTQTKLNCLFAQLISKSTIDSIYVANLQLSSVFCNLENSSLTNVQIQNIIAFDTPVVSNTVSSSLLNRIVLYNVSVHYNQSALVSRSSYFGMLFINVQNSEIVQLQLFSSVYQIILFGNNNQVNPKLYLSLLSPQSDNLTIVNSSIRTRILIRSDSQIQNAVIGFISANGSNLDTDKLQMIFTENSIIESFLSTIFLLSPIQTKSRDSNIFVSIDNTNQAIQQKFGNILKTSGENSSFFDGYTYLSIGPKAFSHVIDECFYVEGQANNTCQYGLNKSIVDQVFYANDQLFQQFGLINKNNPLFTTYSYYVMLKQQFQHFIIQLSGFQFIVNYNINYDPNMLKVVSNQILQQNVSICQLGYVFQPEQVCQPDNNVQYCSSLSNDSQLLYFVNYRCETQPRNNNKLLAKTNAYLGSFVLFVILFLASVIVIVYLVLMMIKQRKTTIIVNSTQQRRHKMVPLIRSQTSRLEPIKSQTCIPKDQKDQILQSQLVSTTISDQATKRLNEMQRRRLKNYEQLLQGQQQLYTDTNVPQELAELADERNLTDYEKLIRKELMKAQDNEEQKAQKQEIRNAAILMLRQQDKSRSPQKHKHHKSQCDNEQHSGSPQENDYLQVGQRSSSTEVSEEYLEDDSQQSQLVDDARYDFENLDDVQFKSLNLFGSRDLTGFDPRTDPRFKLVRDEMHVINRKYKHLYQKQKKRDVDGNLIRETNRNGAVGDDEF